MTRHHSRALILLATPLASLALAACHQPPHASPVVDATAIAVPALDASVTRDASIADAAPSDAAPSSRDASPTAFSGPRIELNVESQITENVDYAVEGTALRVRIHGTQRATLINGGHVWGGTLTACDGDTCSELSLSGPSQPPVHWHGFGFELFFVEPTSLRISRAS